jgi:hypothetical protein
LAAGLIERVIDEHTYEFQKWGAEESVQTLLQIGGLAGKPLMQAVSAVGSQEGKQKLELDVLGAAIGSLIENAHNPMTMALIKKLSSEKVLCDGKKINFDHHYQDRLDHLFRVVSAAVEVQYGNFFAAFRGAAAMRRTPATSPA